MSEQEERKRLSELLERRELKRLMIEKERGRAESAISSQQQHESLKDRALTGAKEIVEDVPLVAANAAMLGFGDEAWGRVAGAWKKATGDKRPSEEIYKQYRDEWRQRETAGRERSPISTFVADVLTPNPLSKLKAIGPISTGAIQGYGYSEGDEPVEDIAKGATFGAGAKVIGKTLKWAGGEPRSSEAKYLEGGSLPQARAKSGSLGIIEETKDAVDRHRARGLFSKGADDYDINTDSYVSKKGQPLMTRVQAPSKRDVLIKMEKANKKARNEIKRILKEKSPDIEGHNYEERRVKTGKSRLKKGGYGEYEDEYEVISPIREEGVYGFEDLKSYDDSRLVDIENYLDHKFGTPDASRKINQKSIERSYANNNTKGRVFTLENLQDEKNRIYDELQAEYKAVAGGAAPKYTALEIEAKKQMARLYKDFINEMSGDPNLAKLNQTMSDNFMFSEGLNKRTAKGFFGERTEVAQDASKGGLWNRIESTAENIIDPSRPYRAKAMRMIEDLPQGVKDYSTGQGSAAGGKMFNIFQDKEEPVEGLGGRPFGSGRPEDKSVVEDIIKTPLPRTTQGVIDNKEAVLAKVAQQAPEMFDAIQDTINDSPELIPDLLPVIANAAPQLFDNDKYNRIDGKILDPNLKAMARKDTMNNEDLSNSERMLVISRLNRTGEFAL